MLEVNNLKTHFKTQDGVVKAVDGVRAADGTVSLTVYQLVPFDPVAAQAPTHANP